MVEIEGISRTSSLENEGWLGVEVAAGVDVYAAVGGMGVGAGVASENSPHASNTSAVSSRKVILSRFLLGTANTPFLNLHGIFKSEISQILKSSKVPVASCRSTISVNCLPILIASSSKYPMGFPSR
jgi:hypothetical protein